MKIKLTHMLIGVLALAIVPGCATHGKQSGEVITPGGNIFHAKGLIAPGEFQKARGE